MKDAPWYAPLWTGRSFRYFKNARAGDGATVGRNKRWFELDENGRRTTVIAPNGGATHYVRDDFGQTLAVTGVDSGTTTRRFDVAGRLIAGTDANGNRATYEYDVAGCVVRQCVADANVADASGKQSVTRWRYEGIRLIGIDHPEQSERYSYDRQGRVSAQLRLQHRIVPVSRHWVAHAGKRGPPHDLTDRRACHADDSGN